MKVNKVIAGAVLATLASPAALAATTGNVGVVSNYMFRGLDQSSQGAAVQGGIDHDFKFLKGLYSGVWISNASLLGGNEADVYAGYGFKLGQFNLDGGVIYYAYTEDTENGGKNLDYGEVYVGGSVGPATVKIFYAPEFSADTGGPVGGAAANNTEEDDELLYVTASATLTLNDTISFVPQVGFSAGDGAKGAFGDEYTDYSITAIKKLKDDMSISLAIVGTDLDVSTTTGTGPTAVTTTDSDNPKFVIGFKKSFRVL